MNEVADWLIQIIHHTIEESEIECGLERVTTAQAEENKLVKKEDTALHKKKR